ncbi:RNA binding protein [Panicum miliaceum]|uniref:RNA binding protein n=1 Tax=Panicum miliaceum TaxID=4540 RepID=A0A3L6PWA3_PANMI|nr:RNA binding protein [Panicum miliaceum]
MASAASIAPAVVASRSFSFTAAAYPSASRTRSPAALSCGVRNQQRPSTASACLQPPTASHGAATRLSSAVGTSSPDFSVRCRECLSFRTTEESLRSALEKFGQLTEGD